jgi:hypothetical protein
MDQQVFIKKIIKNFSQICAPIIETIKENKQPFEWTVVVDRNFQILKKKIIGQHVLALPDFEKSFHIAMDASGTTIGVVLS